MAPLTSPHPSHPSDLARGAAGRPASFLPLPFAPPPASYPRDVPVTDPQTRRLIAVRRWNRRARQAALRAARASASVR